MKIRMDFVTNSSSSSYTSFIIENRVLEKLYEQAGLSDCIVLHLNFKGCAVYDRFSFESHSVGIPYTESFSTWLLECLKFRDSSYYEKDNYNSLAELIKTHKNDIDRATKKAFFYEINIVTDDEGGSFEFQENRGNNIYVVGFNYYDWEERGMTEKTGEEMWEFLSSDEEEIADFAKKHFEIKEFSKPQRTKETAHKQAEETAHKQAEESKPEQRKIGKEKQHELSSPGLLSGLVCCLTGNFNYGSKDDVRMYIESLGGTCTSSVTDKTNILIIGTCGSENDSLLKYDQKYLDAKRMIDSGSSMMILDEKEFFEKYKSDNYFLFGTWYL